MGMISKILGSIYLLIGLYLINLAFDLISLPEVVSSIEWIIFLIAAFFIIIAGIKSFLKKKYKNDLPPEPY